MLLLRTDKLPDSPDLLYEIKLDGYRAIAFKSGGKVHLRSRNDNDFAVPLCGHCQDTASHARRIGH
jgi:ATP-dependent DNA ligase